MPAATSLTTLPVLIAIGGGVSLLSVVSNLLAVPVMPAVVGLGFAAALCSGALARFSGKADGSGALLLRWMLAVAEWTASVPYAFLHVSGAFAMCAALLLCIAGQPGVLRNPCTAGGARLSGVCNAVRLGMRGGG